MATPQVMPLLYLAIRQNKTYHKLVFNYVIRALFYAVLTL